MTMAAVQRDPVRARITQRCRPMARRRNVRSMAVDAHMEHSIIETPDACSTQGRDARESASHAHRRHKVFRRFWHGEPPVSYAEHRATGEGSAHVQARNVDSGERSIVGDSAEARDGRGNIHVVHRARLLGPRMHAPALLWITRRAQRWV